MGQLFPLEVLEPHQIVGYWGYGDQAALENWLTDSLRHCNLRHCSELAARRYSRSPGKACLVESTTECVWGVAYLGLPQADCDHLPARVLVALTASGLPCPSESAAAWVTQHPDRLSMGREPFGHVPLYWTQIGQIVWFASRLSLLLPLIKVPQVSIPAVYAYSCFSYVPIPLTPIAQIASIAPGAEQTWIADPAARTLSAPTVKRLFEWQEAPDQIQDEVIAVEQLRSLLKDAVACQSADLGDEPVGVLLSGGLDSSIVAALLVEAGVKVRAYTLDFGAESVSELSYAEQVAEFLNIPLIKVDASPRQVRQALLPTAQALDLPFGDGVTVPLFLLMQAASQDVRVVFNGEGGDQLFAGWTNKPLIAAGMYQATHPTETTFDRHYLRTFHRLWGYEQDLFQPEIFTQLAATPPQSWLEYALNPDFSTTLLHRLRRATLMLKGAQNIHPRATNLALAHGLKVRSPFCDIALAQWSFQLSGTLHLQAACEKYILKRAVEPWLPATIVWRQKRGMGVPLTAWCFNELWHDLGRWLNPATLSCQGIWQPHIAARIATGGFGTLQGRRIGESLWLLLMWQLWHHTALGLVPAFSLNHPFWLPSRLGRFYLQQQRETTPW
ncbi:MAG: asparagine synthetase B [Leptolyngbya sp. BL-A-14]